MNLRIPGPTPCPPEVRAAGASPMIDHRGEDFVSLHRRIVSRLQAVFRTRNEVLLLTSSGTGALEAAVVNTLSPGDRVLAVTVGPFGDRFAEIAEAHGAALTRLPFEPGLPADPASVDRALAADPSIRAVLLTHNETATGVTNDVRSISRIVRARGPLLLVDSVSGLAALPLETDGWGLDVVATASQKAWMTPPGVAMVSVGPRAWEAHARARMPRFYFDFGRAREFASKGQTPWTPAISVLFSLSTALDRIEREGLDAVLDRHRRIGARTRDGVRSLGLRLLAEGPHASDSVTAVRAPDGIEVSDLRRRLRAEQGVVLAGGQGSLKGKVFRIAHLGWVEEREIDEVLQALRAVLASLGPRKG
ncbi:MAG: alanine--glyoxylate aminotransferase family protein [Planctomycetes bacterium]|nr:alanine--glyoxylate aminotransferase family protein [Planctomycetota bacterium]